MPRKKKEDAAEVKAAETEEKTAAAKEAAEEEIIEVPDDFESSYPEGRDSLGAFAGLSTGGIPSAAALNAKASSGNGTGSKVSDEQAEHEKKMKEVEERLRASGALNKFKEPLKPLTDEEVAAKEEERLKRLKAIRENAAKTSGTDVEDMPSAGKETSYAEDAESENAAVEETAEGTSAKPQKENNTDKDNREDR